MGQEDIPSHAECVKDLVNYDSIVTDALMIINYLSIKCNLKTSCHSDNFAQKRKIYLKYKYKYSIYITIVIGIHTVLQKQN